MKPGVVWLGLLEYEIFWNRRENAIIKKPGHWV